MFFITFGIYQLFSMVLGVALSVMHAAEKRLQKNLQQPPPPDPSDQLQMSADSSGTGTPRLEKMTPYLDGLRMLAIDVGPIVIILLLGTFMMHWSEQYDWSDCFWCAALADCSPWCAYSEWVGGLSRP